MSASVMRFGSPQSLGGGCLLVAIASSHKRGLLLMLLMLLMLLHNAREHVCLPFL